MLEHQRPDRRQLVLLMNDRIADRLLAAAEHLPAATALRQMLKPPIDALWRDHLPGLALMTGLATRAAHRPLVSLARQTTTLGPRLVRIRRRRHRAVPRITTRLALQLIDLTRKLLDLCRLLRDLAAQLLKASRHPEQRLNKLSTPTELQAHALALINERVPQIA